MAFQPLITQADAPHFFKIIQPQIVQDGRLRIPKRFVAKYAKDLLDRVYLKVPNGEMWMAKMNISDGEVWLQDGWKEFTDHYSIGLWHFLVFRYEGNSHFHVLIFDMSASEIEYPSPKNIHEERANLNGESKMKRKGVMDKDNIKSKKTRSNSEYKEMKHVKTEEDPHSFDFVKEIGDGASRSMPNTHEVLHQAEKRRMATEIEKARALQFTSENPFFIATMQPSYLKVSLTVPRSFMKRYFSKKDEAIVNVTLGVLDGRTWPVSCVNNMKKLSKGWPTFASDNYLELGDICVFELIKGRENFLNVVIFRARKDAN